MNPNAKITDEQFEAYLKQIRELAEGPFEEIQKEVEVTNTFPEEFYELAQEKRPVSLLPAQRVRRMGSRRA